MSALAISHQSRIITDDNRGIGARRFVPAIRRLVGSASQAHSSLFGLVFAYGPYPLSMDDKTARRYQEAALYMRQSHAERDLEGLVA
jgi:hypothetical protein